MNNIRDLEIYKYIYNYIHTVLDYEIVCYKRKYKKDFTWYVCLEIATMFSSVSIPLLTKMASNSINFIAIMGSLVTILNGLLSFFNLKSHYLLYKHIYKRLELEKYTFEYKWIPYNSVHFSSDTPELKNGLMIALIMLQKHVRQIIVNGERIVNGLDKSGNKLSSNQRNNPKQHAKSNNK